MNEREEIRCPVCQERIEKPQVGGSDVTCAQCGRTWYATADDEMPIAGRTTRVRLTKIPEPGDRYTDVVKPARKPTPNRDAIVAAVDSLKSALFHFRQSNLDEEGRLGLAQAESTLVNLERRLRTGTA